MTEDHRNTKLTYIMLSEPGQHPEIYLRGYAVDATRDVRIDGTVRDALRGIAGNTIGCMLSNCGMGNKHAFPHPVKLCAVTPKNFYVIAKIREGGWADIVLYHHSYGKYVKMNDTGELKKLIKEKPAWMERPFILRRPHHSMTKGTSGKPTGKGHPRPYAPKGALGRAVTAGLISRGVARALQDTK